MADDGAKAYERIPKCHPIIANRFAHLHRAYSVTRRSDRRFRRPEGERIACAYRLRVSPDGQLFGKETGWKEFHEASQKHAQSDGCTHVVCADIADFYNQVSHHRLQGSLEQAGVPANTSHLVERMLSNINAKHHSRGIPVGPAVSVLLAEAALADVDNFIARKYRHTRYVDDFRIFCGSEEHAIGALHDLCEYLHTAHRLSLQSNKIKILEVADFSKSELHDPEESAERAREARPEQNSGGNAFGRVRRMAGARRHQGG